MISSEPQVLGNWRRSLRTFCLQDSLALGSSELTLIPVDCSCRRVPFLPLIFRTSIPWKLETFTQNFWSSVFYQALDQKLDLQMLGRSSEPSVQSLSDASSASLQNVLMHMIF